MPAPASVPRNESAGRFMQFGPHLLPARSGPNPISSESAPSGRVASESRHDLVHRQTGLGTGSIAVIGQTVAEAHCADGAKPFFR